MNRTILTSVLALAAAFAVAFPGFAAKPVPGLTPAGSYSNGYKNAKGKARDFAEIISVSEKTKRAVITIPVEPGDVATPAGASAFVPGIEVLDLSNPTAPTRICRAGIPPTYPAPTSVAIHPSADYLLVAVGTAGEQGYILPYRASTCELLPLGIAAAGIQPDSVIISGSGKWALVTNEAEGPANPDEEDWQGTYGGDGSISVINLQGFHPNAPSPLSILTLALPETIPYTPNTGYSYGRFDGTAWLPIDNSAKTLEPESIVFDDKEDFAYFTLQENNAIGTLNLKTLAITYFPAGKTSHPGDYLDNGTYAVPACVPYLTCPEFLREPDGIGFYRHGNRKYVVTADEGDTAEGYDAGDPNPTEGEPEEGPRGGRTLTVFDAETGAVLGDTGNQIDAIAHDVLGTYDDGRSDRGGAEPEVLDVAKYKGRYYAAVGLERARGVVLVDLTDPSAPKVISAGLAGARPEGVKFYQDKNNLYVLVGNEEGVPTVSVLRLD